MRPTPEISVVIPTRNCLPWLPGAIASIGAGSRIEIIVFDDGSDDGTQAWLAAQVARDPRLVVLRGDGIGPSIARNRAMAAARAPLIALLDADDEWYPGKLDKQLALHRQFPEIAFSFTDYRHVTMAGEDRGGCFAYWPRFHADIAGKTAGFVLGGDAIAQIFAENMVGTSTVMMRTDTVRALGGFSTDLPSSEDWELWLRLARHGQVGCVPEILADYRIHRPGNLTRNLRARMAAVDLIARRYHHDVLKFGTWPENTLRARLIGGHADIAYEEGQPLRAAALRAASLLRAPSRRAALDFWGSVRGLLAG